MTDKNLIKKQLRAIDKGMEVAFCKRDEILQQLARVNERIETLHHKRKPLCSQLRAAALEEKNENDT